MLTSRVTPHTSHLTPHTSHLTPHTSHLTPYTSHLTPHTSHLTRHTSHLTRHTPQVLAAMRQCGMMQGPCLTLVVEALPQISLQSVHVLPQFVQALADVIASVAAAAAADAAAASPADHSNDDASSICLEALSEIAKACKMASLNRECPMTEVVEALAYAKQACDP